MDCTRSPELLFPFPRNLGVLPQELIVLTKVVDHLKAKRVVEFGTAEGRTALNIALHLPPGGEIITLDLPPVPGQNEVGFFYWDQPAKTRIKQIFASVDSWDYRPYRASAELVFCDACDRMPGLPRKPIRLFPWSSRVASSCATTTVLPRGPRDSGNGSPANFPYSRLRAP